MAIEERLVSEKGLGVPDKSTLREVMKTEKAKKAGMESRSGKARVDTVNPGR
jgi:hypothetical protein